MVVLETYLRWHVVVNTCEINELNFSSKLCRVYDFQNMLKVFATTCGAKVFKLIFPKMRPKVFATTCGRKYVTQNIPEIFWNSTTSFCVYATTVSLFTTTIMIGFNPIPKPSSPRLPFFFHSLSRSVIPPSLSLPPRLPLPWAQPPAAQSRARPPRRLSLSLYKFNISLSLSYCLWISYCFAPYRPQISLPTSSISLSKSGFSPFRWLIQACLQSSKPQNSCFNFFLVKKKL